MSVWQRAPKKNSPARFTYNGLLWKRFFFRKSWLLLCGFHPKLLFLEDYRWERLRITPLSKSFRFKELVMISIIDWCFSVNGRSRIQPQLNINCVRLACCARSNGVWRRNDDENKSGGWGRWKMFCLCSCWRAWHYWKKQRLLNFSLEARQHQPPFSPHPGASGELFSTSIRVVFSVFTMGLGARAALCTP